MPPPIALPPPLATSPTGRGFQTRAPSARLVGAGRLDDEHGELLRVAGRDHVDDPQDRLTAPPGVDHGAGRPVKPSELARAEGFSLCGDKLKVGDAGDPTGSRAGSSSPISVAFASVLLGSCDRDSFEARVNAEVSQDAPNVIPHRLRTQV